MNKILNEDLIHQVSAMILMGFTPNYIKQKVVNISSNHILKCIDYSLMHEQEEMFKLINEANMIRKLCSLYCIGNNYKRIYFYHIQKTGGSSLLRSFVKLSSIQEIGRITRHPRMRMVSNGYIYQ